jgi:anti-anti-sigma factor
MAPQDVSNSIAPRVELIQHAPGISVVVLRGEQDLRTRGDVDEALTRACIHEAVVVDLSECTFIYSTVVNMLESAYRAQRGRGWRLVLALGSEARDVGRTLQLSALSAGIPRFETREAAVAGVVAARHVIEVARLQPGVGDAPAYRAACACGWQGDAHGGSHGRRLARREGASHVVIEARDQGRS